MKKIAIVALLTLGSLGVFAQGKLQMANTAGFEVSNNGGGFIPARTSGNLSTYYVSALFMNGGSSPIQYGTNSSLNAGLIGGGNVITATAAANQPFQVYTWSFAVGGTAGANWANVIANVDFTNPLAPTTTQAGLAGLWFGRSALGTITPLDTVANPTGFVPLLFGNGAGQIGGYQLYQITLVPEPSTMVLAGLGSAALLLFRRRKQA